MKTANSTQRGFILLEGLIAILLFSFGILAIVGIQATAVNFSSDAKYRTDAILLANQVIGQMWVSDRTVTTLQTDFQGGNGSDGSKYSEWATDVAAVLPGVAANKPTIAVAPSSEVTVTVRWQAPNDSTVHQAVAIAQIISGCPGCP